MKKIFFALFMIITATQIAVANDYNDSTSIVNLKEVSIVAYKETNSKNTPNSSTLLRENSLNLFQISSIKDMNGIVPNFYVPDYGSSLSSAVYIRGLGSRNSGRSISLYVDNLPYMDKSTFDFELYDLSQAEILRGPQGTLYGRNSMGGIVNIYTLSPMSYQGTKINVKGGNSGFYNIKASHYMKPLHNLGVSVAGYYQHLDGFYTNSFNNSKADKENGAGGRIKAIWLPTDNNKIEYTGSIDWVAQRAFPYGHYDRKTSKTALPNYNDPNDYKRLTVNNSISTAYTTEKIMLNAHLSHQYFDDEMNLDQDFTPMSIFQVQQKQKQNMLNGEIVLKSNTPSDYQWSVGADGFIQQLNANVPVSFKEDAIKGMLNPRFAKMQMSITDSEFRIPGKYNNRTSGLALFHQSTISNLFFDGFSLTGGIRAEIENIKLDYDTRTTMNLLRKTPQGDVAVTLSDSLVGTAQTTKFQFNPRIALKYEWDTADYVYLSISRGHKSGGFNIQMIPDLMQQKLMNGRNPKAKPTDVEKEAHYEPEISWNYEVGFNNAVLNNRFNYSFTVYYSQVKGLQLTQFVSSGSGRKLTNAGKVSSKGIEAALNYQITKEFGFGVSYGLADAKFERYTDVIRVKGTPQEVDYKGKSVPYAPQNTIGANLSYRQSFTNSFVDNIYASLNYNGIGKIYWDEANELTENYYSLVNALAGVKKGSLALELWAKNLLNTKYNVFYFKSFGKDFFQAGKPLQFGATLKIEL